MESSRDRPFSGQKEQVGKQVLLSLFADVSLKIRGCKSSYPTVSFPRLSISLQQWRTVPLPLPCHFLPSPAPSKINGIPPWIRKTPKYLLDRIMEMKDTEDLVGSPSSSISPTEEFSRWKIFVGWMAPLLSAEPEVRC